MVFVGNINQSVDVLLKTSSLFAPFPQEMGTDTAFLDRMHCYLPGWEIPKFRPEHFTDDYGFISDYLAEFIRELRKEQYGDALDHYFRLGRNLNQRDTIAVRRMIDGYLKLMYPNGEFTKEELEELNRIHGQAYDFLFTFNEPEVNGTNIRRSVTVNCSAEDYDAAVEMMREILQGPYRSLIYNISMDSVSAVDADFEPNIKEGRVELTFNMNYFETTEGAESLEGLQVEETQAASGGGLASSDMSNLQRSDLETAAEAAFGE